MVTCCQKCYEIDGSFYARKVTAVTVEWWLYDVPAQTESQVTDAPTLAALEAAAIPANERVCNLLGSGGSAQTAIYGSVYHYYQSLPVAVNTTTTFAAKIAATTPVIPAGVYRISISYGFSNDGTGSDIDVIASFGGVPIHTTALMHRQEPHESGGSDGGDGSGTDQRFGFSRSHVVTVPVAGTKAVSLQWRSSANGVRASIWDALFEVLRVS